MTFDTFANTYDQTFTQSPIAQFLRAQVHHRLQTRYQPGQQVLELGCGTGEDALWLAQQQIAVIATDASDAMLDMARQKTQHTSLVQCLQLDLQSLMDDGIPEALGTTFAGVFANFGVLNCLADWQPLARWLAERIKPGGIAGFAIMGPYCLWEMMWHGAHLDFGVALRRLRGATFQADEQDDATAIPIAYPTVKRITSDFAPYFERVHVQPLGLFLPPSDVYGVIEKRPRAMQWLMMLDTQVRRLSWLAPFADHYWIELRRTPVAIGE